MNDTFIPNSFQTPNDYVDRYMAFLTPEEFKVLVYAVRRIFGFQKRQDRISLNQFADGITLADGRRLDYGTGLNPKTVKRAIDGLLKAGLLVKLEEAKPDRIPALYGLQLNPEAVNIHYLETRQVKRYARDALKMGKARAARNITHKLEQGYAITPVQGYAITNDGGYGITLQKTEENQKKTTTLKSEISDVKDDGDGMLLSFSSLSFLEEDKDNFLKILLSFGLKGEPTEKQIKHFAFRAKEFGDDKALAYLRWAAEQGWTWAKAYNVDRKASKIASWQISEGRTCPHDSVTSYLVYVGSEDDPKTEIHCRKCGATLEDWTPKDKPRDTWVFAEEYE